MGEEVWSELISPGLGFDGAGTKPGVYKGASKWQEGGPAGDASSAPEQQSRRYGSESAW